MINVINSKSHIKLYNSRPNATEEISDIFLLRYHVLNVNNLSDLGRALKIISSSFPLLASTGARIFSKIKLFWG